MGEPEEFSAEGRRHRRRRAATSTAQTRKNDTHASKTDPDARLYRKSEAEARLAYLGHVLIENRHGLIVDAMATQATGTAERDAAC